MGDMSTSRLNGVINVDKYYCGNGQGSGKLYDDPDLDRDFKASTSLVFFGRFPEECDWEEEGHGNFGGGLTKVVGALRKVGWDDDIIYSSIVETKDVFLEDNGITNGSGGNITRCQYVELYDTVVDKLGVYLKVGK